MGTDSGNSVSDCDITTIISLVCERYQALVYYVYNNYKLGSFEKLLWNDSRSLHFDLAGIVQQIDNLNGTIGYLKNASSLLSRIA